MSRFCVSCSAPLPANEPNCTYCLIRNDIELKYVQPSAFTSLDNVRHCVKCETKPAMDKVKLFNDEQLIIDKCPSCFSLFIDHFELDHALQKAGDEPSLVNEQLLEILVKETKVEKKIQYYPCPDCNILMKRHNFGYRSGTVVDICQEHGVWLDNGELKRIVEWRRAGGHIKHVQRLEDRVEEAERKVKMTTVEYEPSENHDRHFVRYNYFSEMWMLHAVIYVFRKIFSWFKH